MTSDLASDAKKPPPSESEGVDISRLLKEGRDHEALSRCKELVERESVLGKMWLGWLYETGRGVAVDAEQARRWYESAAESNWPVAQHYLAHYLLYTGDQPNAFQWLSAAAAQGYPPAIMRLSFAYRDGAGVRRDNNQADELLRRAANLQNFWAKSFLAAQRLARERSLLGKLKAYLAKLWIAWQAFLIANRDPDDERLRH